MFVLEEEEKKEVEPIFQIVEGALEQKEDSKHQSKKKRQKPKLELIPVELYANVGVVGGTFDGRNSVGRSGYVHKTDYHSKVKKTNKKQIIVKLIY